MTWKSLSWKLILLLIAATIIFLWLIKAPVMSWYLSDKLQVPVAVRTISIWPSQTKIHHLKVLNPRGFKSKRAFEATTTTIHYRTDQLLSNPCEIERIEIDGIFLSIDCSNPLCSSNNWTAIGDKIAKKEQDREKKPGRRVIVHKMILSDMIVEIRGLGIGQLPQTKKIARLEFNEVDSQKGFPTKKLIQSIFQGSGLDQYIKNAFNPQNVIEKFLPKLFGNAEVNPFLSQSADE